MTSVPDGYSDSAESQRQVRGRKQRLRDHALPPAQRPGPILLVDNDPKFQQIMREFLALKGFRVIVASSGQEALEQLMCSDPWVVLLDMKMPEMDGLSTLKRIRVSHPNVPVIFVTQGDEEEIIGEARLLGVNDCLLKPFSFEALEAILLTKIVT